MSFLQLPFSQVKGAEPEQQGWEVQGGYPVILIGRLVAIPRWQPLLLISSWNLVTHCQPVPPLGRLESLSAPMAVPSLWPPLESFSRGLEPGKKSWPLASPLSRTTHYPLLLTFLSRKGKCERSGPLALLLGLLVCRCLSLAHCVMGLLLGGCHCPMRWGGRTIIQ